MVVADGQGLPVGDRLYSASPGEVTLAEETLKTVSLGKGRRRKKPKRLICDRAYDSETLRWRLAQRSIELICPHRRGRKRRRLQDGRSLRRYKRRWKIERLFAWLGNFRRLTIRYERSPKLFEAFVHIAFIMIVIRHF